MTLWCILYMSLFPGIVNAIIIDGQLYKSADNLVGETTLATVETWSPVLCGLHCMGLGGAGFSYHALTRECRIFEKTFYDSSGSIVQQVSIHTYGKVGICDIVPLLQEERSYYTTEHPFMKDNALTRYRCTKFTDTEPVESCPVSRCEKNWSPASLSCSEKDLYVTDEPYFGRVTCTVGGITCQRWDSSTPHQPYYYINRSDLHNWCQVDSESKPWCYTTDPQIRWDFCPSDERIVCINPPPTTILGVRFNMEWPYNESYSVARYRCPAFVTTAPNTSCPVARCLSDNSWSTANVSCPDKECYDPVNRVYNGRVSCTWTGLACQRWDSDYPHRHSINHGRSDLGNRCVMSGYSRPWCYTVHPSIRWAWCPVDKCP